ncbi:MAG: DUF1127 domain-containing protein [Pseudomonadota bacterium]
MIYLSNKAQFNYYSARANKAKENINLGKISIYVQRLHTRRQLKQLSDNQLVDIGMSREQALAEARLPFWR